MTEQPLPPPPAGSETQSETQDTGTGTPERSPLLLRISMVFLAGTVIAFSYFAPLWMDRGITKVNHDRLYNIARDTAQKVSANNWNARQGMDYALKQSKVGNLDTTVKVEINDKSVTVTISGSAVSANPFAALTGAGQLHRIDVAHTYTN